MPLRITQEPTEPESLKTVKEEYLIFYSSIVDGQSWCPVRALTSSGFDRLLT